MNALSNSLLELNRKITDFEGQLTSQTKQLDSRGLRWFQYDDKKEKFINEGAAHQKININVGGKIFHTTLLTILNNPDCLLFNLIMTDQWDFKEEIYFDRGYTYFNVLLSYLRNQKVNLTPFGDEEVPLILREAEFYHIYGLIDFLRTYVSKIYFLCFEYSGEYRSGNNVAGTNNIEDINNFDDTSCTRGICTGYTGWIVFELNKEVDFDKLEIGSFRGNTNIYSSSNGSGATIKTSLDKTNWVTVGTIHSNYANGPYIHNISPSRAKYIKFEYSSYIGIGYLRVIR